MPAHEGLRFWKPDCAAVNGMFRIERDVRPVTTYAERFAIVVLYEGAFDGWHRGRIHTQVAGSLKLKEPGEVHRHIRVHAPFTVQGAVVTQASVAAAADAMNVRGAPHFREPDVHTTRLAFAMHDALVRPDATEIERDTLVTELLMALVSATPPARARAARSVRRAQAFLHDALASRVTLDDVAAHAGLDKFHLVRAFRSEVGLPPYEYLTVLRVSRARELLQSGTRASETAQAVGFCDQSQLHRHFKRIVGMSPGAFARSFVRRKKGANIAQAG